MLILTISWLSCLKKIVANLSQKLVEENYIKTFPIISHWTITVYETLNWESSLSWQLSATCNYN